MNTTTTAANDTAARRTYAHEGERYAETRNLDIAAIAKLVRADLKGSDEIPRGLKVSVRIDRYSMGQSLDAKVTAIPEGFQICSRDYVRAELADPHARRRRSEFFTDAAAGVLKAIEQIVEAYNFDNSDMMSDYFHNRFASTVSFDWKLEGADRARAEAEIAAESAPAPAPAPVEPGDMVEYLTAIGEL